MTHRNTIGAPAPGGETHPAVNTVADLATGDRLLTVGGVGFAQFRDPAANPVLVCGVRPPLDSDDADAIAEVTTSAGIFHVRMTAPAQAVRDDTVRTGTILLISRRQSLHAELLALGVPVIRRTPVTADQTAPAVTAVEWNATPLIVIDAYLAQETLRAIWSRGDLAERQEIVMVGDNPDEARVEGRQRVARARWLAMLPYDRQGVTHLFREATGTAAASGIDHSTLYADLTLPRG